MRTAWGPYWRYFRRVRGYKFPLAVGILSDLFSTFLTMVPPLFAILIFDYAYPQRDLRLLSGAILAGLVIYFVNFLFSSINDYINIHIDQKITARLASDLFHKILYLPFAVRSKRNIGDLTVRTMEDSDLAAGMILNTPQVLLINLATLGLFLVISLSINPYVTLLSLASIPVYIFETRFFSGRLEELQRDVQTNRSETLDGLQERLINVRTVKAFGREDKEQDFFNNLLFRRRHLTIKQKVISLVSAFTNSITLQLWSTFVTWYMGFEVIQGRLSIGQLIALSAYLPQLAEPIHALANLYTNLRVGMVSLRRVDEILNLPSEKEEAEGEEIEIQNGRLQFKELFFGYEPPSRVLENISLDIKPHSSLAIVGESGAGKSTLVNLLPRFYNCEKGMILVDGYDVQRIRLKALRSQIGVVFQEISLFAGTIRDNILYGRPEATDQELQEAAQMAAAHEFIVHLPGGYDFRIEPFGQNLSGGQRQRIAISRALVMNPKILILDEAVSALDAESEFLIQETIRRCREKMTVILVAHRFATIKGVDKVIVLDKGRVAEAGTFSELLAKKGRFFTLYQLQTGGFQEFQQRLQIEFARYERYKQDLSLLILKVNEYDDYVAREKSGRVARLMEELNLFIRRYLRIMDFSSVFRDDRIIIGLPQTPSTAAKRLGLRIQHQIASHSFDIDGEKASMTASLVLASCRESKARYAEDLIEKAELSEKWEE